MRDEEGCATACIERQLEVFEGGGEILMKVEVGCRHVRQRLSVLWIPFENFFESGDGVVVFLTVDEIENSGARSRLGCGQLDGKQNCN